MRVNTNLVARSPDHPDYIATRTGEVWSTKRRYPKKLKPTKNRRGYECLRIGGKNVTVHKLVLGAFVSPRQCNHIDGDKTNNRVENLEWCSPLENIQHSFAVGLSPVGENHSQSKLTEEIVREIKYGALSGVSNIELAGRLGVSKQTISLIRLGKTWAHVDDAMDALEEDE